jgi:large subunit ribosomal protein L29
VKADDLRELSDDELREKERDLRRELWETRFQNYTNQLDDTAKIRRTRRDIARVQTLLAQRMAAKND